MKILLFLAAMILSSAMAAVAPVQDQISLAPLYSALQWRELGPFRGGWSTMAAGVPSAPNVFYFGGADGGVWKTTDAGLTWRPLLQHAGSISVGALAIAPSNPKIIYVGTGQVATRYDVVGGDGMYRSSDGGKTWVHAGLDDSRHIGRIWIDPHNPDVVLVAALGHYFGPNAERGVFRSEDGGQHWSKVLFVNDDTGAVDLAADDAYPSVIFAATWQARQYPWLAYYKPEAGPGSGIWKSTDEGKTWTRLKGHGLPPGPLGRIGLAVAPGTHAQRVYAVIDAPKHRGLYRSDNGGADWSYLGSPVLANSYFDRIAVDAQNPDVLYVMNRSVAKSTDGGKSFTWFKGAPGGDDYHFMWINPDDDQYMIVASDQGTSVSVDGGAHWSSWYNQPTGQFYHVATDQRFPYRVYSGQQDSGTVETRSRSDYGNITVRDWHPVGGDERSYAVPDRKDPNIVYVGGLGGHVSRFNARTGLVQNISATPISHYGERPSKTKYRYNWFYPVVTDPHAPHTLYLGAQVLFRSADGGMHWQTISPDLSGANPKAARNCNNDDLTLVEARSCGYGEIFTIAPSPVKAGEIWVGTTDGVIHLTRDGGKRWQNVTPTGIPLWGRVNQIDASPTDPATAYAAVDAHRRDDRGTYIYRTHDYGRSWSLIVKGIPSGQYAYVVRQDPQNPRLLYAGTNTGVYVSFDDGGDWQPLQLNLPNVRVRDLTIHGNDLVVATQGRALWVLDDVAPLRQASAAVLDAGAYLFNPEDAVRVRNNSNKDTPLPPEIPAARNPPTGAVIDYWLGADVHGPVTLAIYDDRGMLVRKYASNVPPAVLRIEPQYFANGWLSKPRSLSGTPGMHRFVWDLRYPRPESLRYSYGINAIYGVGTPVIPRGPLVLPGRYDVKLTVDGRTYSRPLSVTLDPRAHPADGALQQQLALAQRIGQAMNTTAGAYHDLAQLHAQLEALSKRLAANPPKAAMLHSVNSLSRKITELQAKASDDHNLRAINSRLTDLATQINDGDRAPPAAYVRAFEQYKGYAEAALQQWQAIQSADIPALNRKLVQRGLTPLRL